MSIEGVNEEAFAQARAEQDSLATKTIDQQLNVLIDLANIPNTSDAQIEKNLRLIEKMISKLHDERKREAYKNRLKAMSSAIQFVRGKREQT